MGLISSLFGNRSGRHERKVLRSGSEHELIELAQSLVQGDHEERALAVMREAQRRFPESTAIQQTLESVENSVAWKSIHETLPHLETNDSAELRARLAEMYRTVGDTATALRLGREAIQGGPEHPSGYRVVGKIYLEQFRITSGSIEGMNALRCLFKAHTLRPDDSSYLVKLAEIFVILEAPMAASKFLQPVKNAFGTDPQVVHLSERIESLPPEETTQIQDLFLKLERRQQGEEPVSAGPVTLSTALVDELTQLAVKLPATEECYIVDGSRRILWSHALKDFDANAFGDSFGLLADTARQMTKRMGIGDFQRLYLSADETSALMGGLEGELSFLHLGNDKTKKEDAESVLERVEKQITAEFSGAGS